MKLRATILCVLTLVMAIRVTAADGAEMWAISDAQGYFRVEPVAAGQLTVRLDLIGYSPQEHHVVATTDGAAVICAVMQQRLIPLNH